MWGGGGSVCMCVWVYECGVWGVSQMLYPLNMYINIGLLVVMQ